MKVLSAILANAILTVAALGYGSVLRRLFPRTFSPFDRLGFTLLGGLGLLGTLLFDVGQAWFSRTAIDLVMLPGVVLGIKLIICLARKRDKDKSIPRVAALPAMVVAGVLLVTAVGGLVRPVGNMDNDSIAYHYLGPKIWLREGVIRPVPDQSLTAFPAVVEAQYAALMAVGGQRAPQFFSLIGISVIPFIVMGLSIRLGLDTRGAWWAAALVLTMPAVYNGGWGGFIDVIFAAFVLAAARVALDAEKTSHFFLSGVFCGFAMGTKYTGLIASAILGLLVLLISISSPVQNRLIVLKGIILAGAISVAVASPVYLRNWLLLGCPICPPPPLLPRFFHVKYFSPSVIHAYIEYIRKRGSGLGRGPISFALLPFNLTYHTASFNGSGGIGLAPLALGPFGLIARRCDRFARQFALFGLLLTVAWFVTEQESRFLIHVYVIGAIFAVLGWKYVVRVVPRFGPALSAMVIACSISYGSYMITLARINDLHAEVSSSFACTYRQKQVPFQASFQYLNADPSVTKVLILDPFVPAYYLNKSYIKPIGSLGEQTLPEGDNLRLILANIHDLHVSHILDVQCEGRSFQLPKSSPRLKLIFQDKSQRIYRVK